MKTPCHRVRDIAARFARILIVLFVAFSLYAPKSAHAQPSLSTLQAAFSGSTGALASAIGYPLPYPFDPTTTAGANLGCIGICGANGTAWDINTMVAAMATTVGQQINPSCDLPLQPTCMSLALAEVNNAMAGNAASLTLLQNYIGPAFWTNYINNNYVQECYDTDFDGFPDFCTTSYLAYPDVYGRVVNPISSAISLMMAGAGNQATQTIYNAMCNSDPGAIDVLNTLLYNPQTVPPVPYTGASASTFLLSMQQGLTGSPPNLAQACSILTQALAGDVTANSGINLAIASILYVNQIISPPCFQ